MENWAIDQLGMFLGFDPETLKTQVMPYLMSFDSPTTLSEHLQDMLGTNEDTINFIQRFVQQRFPPQPASVSQKKKQQQQQPKQQTYAKSASSSSSSSASNHRQQEPSSHFPSLPPNTNQTTSWPGNMTVYMKNKDGDHTSSKSNKNKKTSATHSQGGENGSLVSDRLEKKKNKNNNNNSNNMTLETALKELDINVNQGGKRKVCNCQATKHDLLTIAPNCLNCGKIICVMEGIGPCSFCGTPVLSKEQQISLIADAKKKRSEQKQQQHRQLQQERKAAKATSTTSGGYASKVSGEIVSKYIFDQQVEDEQRQRAESHKEKLLEFQRTSAQRSTVIDQATDFTLPTDQSNPWLTQQERAMQLKKQQANMKRLEGGRTGQRRVLTIDIGSKQAKVDTVMDDDSSSSSSEEEEPKELISSATQDSSSRTFAKNPLLKGIQGPQFRGANVGKQKGVKQAGGTTTHQGRKSRIQFDGDDGQVDQGVGLVE
ncbi:putative zinc finger motif, C2HC5-type-domain-containing protein [Chlamydoabsidia padenii]|nr:putative zinc finger motif, C2HC5-type-domain-containing protein [Chlamydoabsidia padenii]